MSQLLRRFFSVGFAFGIIASLWVTAWADTQYRTTCLQPDPETQRHLFEASLRAAAQAEVDAESDCELAEARAVRTST